MREVLIKYYTISDIMKFHAKIALLKRPFLRGKSEDKNFDHYVKSSCHEFSVESVDLQEQFLVYSSRALDLSLKSLQM